MLLGMSPLKKDVNSGKEKAMLVSVLDSGPLAMTFQTVLIQYNSIVSDVEPTHLSQNLSFELENLLCIHRS
jgi:hypothetical protein